MKSQGVFLVPTESKIEPGEVECLLKQFKASVFAYTGIELFKTNLGRLWEFLFID